MAIVSVMLSPDIGMTDQNLEKLVSPGSLIMFKQDWSKFSPKFNMTIINW